MMVHFSSHGILNLKKELYIDDQVVSSIVTEKKILQFLDDGNSITETTPKIIHSRSELISIFKQVNQLLRKEGLEEGKERFYEFSNILFLKLISEIEEEREKNEEVRIVPKNFCWNEFNKKDAESMFYYVKDTILKELKKTYGEIFSEKLNIKPKTLKMIVDKLSEITLLNIESDVKGDAFEYFLKTSITIGNDLAQYFTPRHIVTLMINLIDPKFGEKIYDPTCGTGGFLISTFNYIKDRSAKTNDVLKILKEKTIWGRELTGTAKIAKMNMIITGDGHTNIEQKDTLEYPIKNKYDVVVANPPFAQTTDHGSLYDIPSNDGDIVFLEHIIDSLKDEDENGEGAGRAVVIIPEGVLFRSHTAKKLREDVLLTKCNIEAIISLPQGVFRPYTKNKTDIIIFKKDKRGTDSIWFYDLTADGFELNSDLRKSSDKNDIPDLLSKWTSKIESSKSWNVSIDEIKKHGFDLMAKTYQPKTNTDKSLVKLSQFLIPVKRPISIKDNQEYKQVKVKLYGKGAVLRRKKIGTKILTKKQFITQKNDLIISKIDARNGAFAIIDEVLDGAVVSVDFPTFEINKSKIKIDYLGFFLKYYDLKKYLLQSSKGTTGRQRIKTEDFLNLEIPLPLKEVQQTIISRLNNQTNIIENAQKTIDSVNEGITDISDFEGDYEYSDIQDICKNIQSGGTPSRKNPEYFHGDIPWITISDMNRLDYTQNTNEKITNEALKNSTTKMFSENSVLISIFGTICALSLLGVKACTNQNIACIEVDEKRVLPKFLMYYLHTLKPHFQTISRGTTQKAINQNMIKSIRMPIPTLEIQNEIISKIDERKSILEGLEKTKENSRIIIQKIIDNLFKSEL